MVVNELVTRFSFLGSLKPQQQFNANLSTSIKLVGATVLALKTLSVGFHALVTAQLQFLASMTQLRNETGISTARIEQLGYVAVATGGSVEGMNSTLDSLNQKIGDAALNGSETFARLGVSIRGANGELKSADAVLIDVRNRLSSMNLSRQERMNFASSLGIDSSLIKFLNLSQSEFAKYNQQAKQALYLTDKQADAVEKHNIALQLTGITLRGLRNQIAVAFAPELTRLNKWFTELLNNNREWIIKGITKAGEALGKLGEMIIRLSPILLALGAAFLVWQGIALAPILLITTGIVALILLVDDLIVAFQGGKSVIADFFQELFEIDIRPILVQMVNHFKEAFDAVAKLFKSVFGRLGSAIKNLIKGNFGDAIMDLLKAFQAIGDFILAMFARIFKEIGRASIGILPDWAISMLGADPAATTMLLPPNSSGTENKTVSQTNNITVISSDPDKAGRMTADRLSDQLDNADALIGRGGK